MSIESDAGLHQPRSPSLVYCVRGGTSSTRASAAYGSDGCARSGAEKYNALNSTPSARAVFDGAYNGTGNWTFNVAFSGSLGLRAAVVHVRNLEHAQRFIERGIPLAISYSWKEGELPGAPLEHSDGHLAVLCGFTANGDCAMNDPAAPNVRVVYPRGSIEAIWQRNHGVAYAVAPAGLDFVAIANS